MSFSGYTKILGEDCFHFLHVFVDHKTILFFLIVIAVLYSIGNDKISKVETTKVVFVEQQIKTSNIHL